MGQADTLFEQVNFMVRSGDEEVACRLIALRCVIVFGPERSQSNGANSLW